MQLWHPQIHYPIQNDCVFSAFQLHLQSPCQMQNLLLPFCLLGFYSASIGTKKSKIEIEQKKSLGHNLHWNWARLSAAAWILPLRQNLQWLDQLSFLARVHHEHQRMHLLWLHVRHVVVPRSMAHRWIDSMVFHEQDWKMLVAVIQHVQIAMALNQKSESIWHKYLYENQSKANQQFSVNFFTYLP